MKRVATSSLLFFYCCVISRLLSVATEAEPQIRKAIPLNEPTATTTQEVSSDIRIAPIVSNDPVKIREAQLAVAEGFYQRKEYDLASLEFQKFLQSSTLGEAHRDQVLFHLAEAYRWNKKNIEAQATYQQLLRETPSGEIAGLAAYHIGEYYRRQKEFQKAIEAFSQAAQLSNSITIKNAARYQEAFCHDALGEQEKAALLFDEVSKTTDDKTTRAAALMLAADEDEKLGHTEKAQHSYLEISSESPPQIAAEALLKAGMISTRLKDNKQALQLFEKAADLKEGGAWSSVAALGIMKIAYEEKDDQKVVMRSPQALASSNSEEVAQALFLTSQSERRLGHLQKALEFNQRILKEFAGTESAHDAAFLHLLLLQSLKDPSLLKELNNFMITTSDPHQKGQALLLQAETEFQQGDYTSAAKAYHSVRESDLSPALKADAAYKEAWSLQQLGEITAALAAYSAFLTTYPEATAAADALIQHAYLKQKQGDLDASLADYSCFLEHYPHSPQCELVLQQKALVQGAKKENRAMTATFQQLLAAYPKSSATAEANYWIGWNSFEEKDYLKAIPFFEKAKQLNIKKFGEQAGIRLLLCHYYLQQPELAAHDTIGLPATTVPGEVLRWIGFKAQERGDLDQTEEFLNQVVARHDPNLTTRDVVMALAETLIKKKKYSAARAPAAKALDLATDPATRAAAILALAQIEHGLGNESKAESLNREALLLQPEGPLNMEGRLLMGDLLLAQHHEEEAARAYMAIALLTEDKTIAPRALRKAAEAYRHANKNLESQKALKELKQRFPDILITNEN